MTGSGGASLLKKFRAFTKAKVEARRRHPVLDVVTLRGDVVVRLRAKDIAVAHMCPWL
jgi:hypothetical protein